MTEAYIDVFLIAKLYVVHDRLMRCSSSKDGHLLLSLAFHLKATYGSQQPGRSKQNSFVIESWYGYRKMVATTNLSGPVR
ncbi:hypothetical protein HFO98_23245 [Rhizobium leguminosarum]|uniref:hypothetical protein n=1 Tax=Rhizobium leguminosarum TaxID=384 RepID=UPI001C94F217|nr:hypothetical protein [Rhizobium leguminosarum]MBY5411315.1 hypothetical protein [Rhizobium leguminosarum]